MIGSNPNISLSDEKIRFAVIINRIQTMEPTSHKNLDMFLQSYNLNGQYILVPSIADEDLTSIHPMLDYYITKREIYVKDAWEIGTNDIEISAISEDDDPIIPKGVTHPPIFQLLRIKRDGKPKKRKRLY